MKLRGPIPNFYIHVSLSNLYVYCHDRSSADQSWEYNSLTDTYMNVEIGRQNITVLFCFGNNEAAQFHFCEYINQDQTFI